MYIATLAWVLLICGYRMRRKPGVHIPLILSGILIDYSLVIYLQLTKDAVQTALKFELSPLQQIHIGVSSIAVMLYIPVIILGTLLYRDRTNIKLRALHLKIARTTLALRTLGFLFMFSMLK